MIINKDTSYYLHGTGTDIMAETDTLVTRISATGNLDWYHLGGSGRDRPIKIVSNRTSDPFVLVRQGGRNLSGPTATVNAYDKRDGSYPWGETILNDGLVSSTYPVDLNINFPGDLVVGGTAKPLCDITKTNACAEPQHAFVSLVDSTSMEQWYYLDLSSGYVTHVAINNHYVVAGVKDSNRGFVALFPVTPTFRDYKGLEDGVKDSRLPDRGKLPFPKKP